MPNAFSFEDFFQKLREYQEELAAMAELLMSEIEGDIKFITRPYATFIDEDGDVVPSIPEGANKANYRRVGEVMLIADGKGPLFETVTRELGLPLQGEIEHLSRKSTEAFYRIA